MTGSRSIIFLYYDGADPAEKLARVVRAALDHPGNVLARSTATH